MKTEIRTHFSYKSAFIKCYTFAPSLYKYETKQPSVTSLRAIHMHCFLSGCTIFQTIKSFTAPFQRALELIKIFFSFLHLIFNSVYRKKNGLTLDHFDRQVLYLNRFFFGPSSPPPPPPKKTRKLIKILESIAK